MSVMSVTSTFRAIFRGGGSDFTFPGRGHSMVSRTMTKKAKTEIVERVDMDDFVSC